MIIIDKKLLNQVSEKAKMNDRLRMNYNFHESPEDSVQCLLNALEPGTKVPVHRHCYTAETYILLRGSIKMFRFDQEGRQTSTFLLKPEEGSYGVHIPKGQWHSLEVLSPDTVILEIKEGPYSPLSQDDIL